MVKYSDGEHASLTYTFKKKGENLTFFSVNVSGHTQGCEFRCASLNYNNIKFFRSRFKNYSNY